MKIKKILLSMFAVLLSALSIVTFPIDNAKADEYLLESYSVEISVTEVKLPVPDIPDNWAYTITVKDGETILGENVTSCTFSKLGEYTLIYKMHKNGSIEDVMEKTTILKVCDTTAPVITTDGYDLEYFVGDKLTILTATVTDNVDKDLTATVTLTKDGKEQTIENGEFTLKKKGEYILTYKATDLSGNEGILTYKFEVLAKDGLSVFAIIAIVAGVVIIAGGVVLTILVCKKKKAKQIKKEEK